jgi:hypothetical protein
LIAALKTKVKTITEVILRAKTSKNPVRSIKRRRKRGFVTASFQNSL